MIPVNNLEQAIDWILSDETVSFAEAMLTIGRFLAKKPSDFQHEFLLDLQHAYSWSRECRES